MRLNIGQRDWQITIRCLGQTVAFIVLFKITKKLKYNNRDICYHRASNYSCLETYQQNENKFAVFNFFRKSFFFTVPHVPPCPSFPCSFCQNAYCFSRKCLIHTCTLMHLQLQQKCIRRNRLYCSINAFAVTTVLASCFKRTNIQKRLRLFGGISTKQP